jgi:predicted nucleotidyltransferase
LRGLFRLAGFELALEEKLNMPVDVIVADSTFDDVLQNVEREEVIIYEAT